MVLEKLLCSPGRDPAPLIQALERHGAAVTIAPSVALSAPRTVYVDLPEDEYREKKCREIVEEWHSTAAHRGHHE